MVYRWEYDNNEAVPGWPLSTPRGQQPHQPTEAELKEHLRNGGAVKTQHREAAEKFRVMLAQEGFVVTITPRSGASRYPWRVRAARVDSGS